MSWKKAADRCRPSRRVLRNALEHALFAEIEFLDGRLIEAAAKRVEIPAVTSRKAFDEWVKGRGKNAPASLMAGSALVDRIESLQPYHDQSAPEQHPLARLVLHTNHAKHREPAVTAVRIAAMYDDESRPESIDELASLPEEPTRLGDVLGQTPVGTLVPDDVPDDWDQQAGHRSLASALHRAG